MAPLSHNGLNYIEFLGWIPSTIQSFQVFQSWQDSMFLRRTYIALQSMTKNELWIGLCHSRSSICHQTQFFPRVIEWWALPTCRMYQYNPARRLPYHISSHAYVCDSAKTEQKRARSTSYPHLSNGDLKTSSRLRPGYSLLITRHLGMGEPLLLHPSTNNSMFKFITTQLLYCIIISSIKRPFVNRHILDEIRLDVAHALKRLVFAKYLNGPIIATCQWSECNVAGSPDNQPCNMELCH